MIGKNIIVGIDPGASGAFAWNLDGEITAANMPATPMDIFELLVDLAGRAETAWAVCEKVGGYRPGNSAPSAVKFSRHVGHLEMALLAARVPHGYVGAAKWMKDVVGALPKDKTERKNAIKAEMQRRYPSVKVTLINADALGLLTYGVKYDSV